MRKRIRIRMLQFIHGCCFNIFLTSLSSKFLFSCPWSMWWSEKAKKKGEKKEKKRRKGRGGKTQIVKTVRKIQLRKSDSEIYDFSTSYPPFFRFLLHFYFSSSNFWRTPCYPLDSIFLLYCSYFTIFLPYFYHFISLSLCLSNFPSLTFSYSLFHSHYLSLTLFTSLNLSYFLLFSLSLSITVSISLTLSSLSLSPCIALGHSFSCPHLR